MNTEKTLYNIAKHVLCIRYSPSSGKFIHERGQGFYENFTLWHIFILVFRVTIIIGNPYIFFIPVLNLLVTHKIISISLPCGKIMSYHNWGNDLIAVAIGAITKFPSKHIYDSLQLILI